MQKAAIPFKLLLSFYLMPLLGLGFMVVDQLFMGGAWQKLIPASPYVFFWYAIFFNLPHIVCSSVMMLNGEYLKHYKKPLGIILFIAFTVPFVGAYAFQAFQIPRFEAFVLSIGSFAAITVYHVFMQQLGMNKMFARSGSLVFNAIAWTNILPGTAAYLLMFMYGNPMAAESYAQLHQIAIVVASACVAIAGGLYVIAWGKSQTKVGRVYLVANALLSLAGLMAIVYEYWLLALVMPRVVHDLTAFTVYINHDHNRYLEKGKQSHPLYSPLRHLGLPAFVLTPLIAIALAFPISKGHVDLGWAAFYILAFIHYATESIVWKNGTPHRKYLAFTGIK